MISGRKEQVKDLSLIVDDDDKINWREQIMDDNGLPEKN